MQAVLDDLGPLESPRTVPLAARGKGYDNLFDMFLQDIIDPNQRALFFAIGMIFSSLSSVANKYMETLCWLHYPWHRHGSFECWWRIPDWSGWSFPPVLHLFYCHGLWFKSHWGQPRRWWFCGDSFTCSCSWYIGFGHTPWGLPPSNKCIFFMCL